MRIRSERFAFRVGGRRGEKGGMSKQRMGCEEGVNEWCGVREGGTSVRLGKKNEGKNGRVGQGGRTYKNCRKVLRKGEGRVEKKADRW